MSTAMTNITVKGNDAFIPIPDDMLEAAGLKPGDEIEVKVGPEESELTKCNGGKTQ